MSLTRRRWLSSALFMLAPASAAWAATRRTSRAASARKTPVLPSLILSGSASEWDHAVAEACQRGLGRSGGGVVAMDPYTGRVVALVNPASVLFRAYQPCSVFKIVVAIAGLTEGVIKPETTVVCNKGCWMWPGHGPINLRRALAVSCNPYFEWVGERLGYEKIQHYAQTLGLGTPSGINLTGETAGLLPARVAPEAVGHLSSHAAGIATSAIQLARADLDHDQRRRRLPAAGGRTVGLRAQGALAPARGDGSRRPRGRLRAAPSTKEAPPVPSIPT